MRTTRFERLSLPLQRATVICLFGFSLILLLVAIRDAVRRPTRSFDDEGDNKAKGTINGYALTLKPAPIKWSDVVRIDEAQKEGLKLPVFTLVSRRFHTGSTLVSRRPHAGFAAKLTLRNTWVSLPPRGSARPA